MPVLDCLTLRVPKPHLQRKEPEHQMAVPAPTAVGHPSILHKKKNQGRKMLFKPLRVGRCDGRLKSLLFLKVNRVLNKFGVSSPNLRSASLWKYQDKCV